VAVQGKYHEFIPRASVGKPLFANRLSSLKLNFVKQNIYDPDNQFRPLKTPYRCWKFFGEQIKITALSGACFLVNSTHSDKDYY